MRMCSVSALLVSTDGEGRRDRDLREIITTLVAGYLSIGIENYT